MCFCAGVALLLLASPTLAQSSCPEIEAHLDRCRYNRTISLINLYTTLALPGDPTQCVPTSRLALAYRILVPSIFKQRYGEEFDEQVFKHCDFAYDNRYCSIDVHQTRCSCASVCDMLMVVQTMTASALAYPNWSTQGVPYNPNV